MIDERTRPTAPPQPLEEADALCERCGQVNPEDVTVCRNCGNDLLEQRARRLATSRAYEDLDREKPRRRALTGLLTVFGLLLILWTGLNAARIEEWLVKAQTPPIGSAESLFNGATARPFEALAAGLASVPPAYSLDRILQQGTALPPDFAGRYVVVRTDFLRPMAVGGAVVEREDDSLRFVARLRGGAELRGTARIDERGIIQAPEVGLRDGNGDFIAGYGFAQRGEDGGLEVYGVLEAYPSGFRARVYALPEAPAD